MCVILYLICSVGGGGLVVAPGMTHVGLHLWGYICVAGQPVTWQ